MPKDISLPIAAPTAEFESGEPQRLAAIDLGSNSFHLLVANYQNERLQVVARLGEKVQLAAGLDENGYLSEAAMQRALDCLGRFAPFFVIFHGTYTRPNLAGCVSPKIKFLAKIHLFASKTMFRSHKIK